YAPNVAVSPQHGCPAPIGALCPATYPPVRASHPSAPKRGDWRAGTLQRKGPSRRLAAWGQIALDEELLDDRGHRRRATASARALARGGAARRRTGRGVGRRLHYARGA